MYINNYCLIVILLCFTHVQIKAQQNFFNVPSSEITKKGKIFFQQQLNFFSTNASSNSTFCYGLGKNLEIGLNVLGITYDYDQKRIIRSKKHEQPIYPSLGLNIQKQLFEFNRYSIAIGGQFLFSDNLTGFEYYAYLNNKIEFNRTKLVGGFYFGNDNYFGEKTRLIKNLQDVGLQFGLEYQAIKDKCFLQADFLSGENVLSNLIFGGAYKMTTHSILSVGYQIANNTNTSSNGVIIELTLVP